MSTQLSCKFCNGVVPLQILLIMSFQYNTIYVEMSSVYLFSVLRDDDVYSYKLVFLYSWFRYYIHFFSFGLCIPEYKLGG